MNNARKISITRQTYDEVVEKLGRDVVEKAIVDFDMAVVDDPEPGSEAILVCMKKGQPSAYTDNAEARCAGCNADIFHRPKQPEGIIKMCVECATSNARPLDS